jgi:hypothetical protein
MYWARILLGVIFHPIEAFEKIKHYRDKSKTLPVLIMFCLILVVRVAGIYITHFPMTRLKPEDTNIMLEIVKYIVPIASWGITTYAITSIWDGECFLGECMIGAVTAVVPYIVMTIPISLFSRLFEENQKGFINFLNTAILIWVLILLFVGTMVMNDYTFKKTTGVYAVCMAGVLLLWAIFLLLATLTYQLYDSIKDFVIEFRIHTGL